MPDFPGFRAVANPLTNAQSVTPVITGLILSEARLNAEFMPGDELFVPVPVTSRIFKWSVTKGEELLHRNTIRANEARIQTGRFEGATGTDEVDTHSFGFAIDDRRQANQFGTPPALDVSRRAAWLARQAVLLDTEVRKHTLATDPANFGHVITVTAGNGWNEASTMRADVSEAAQYLEDSIGIGRENFVLALFNNARTAAWENPELLSQKAYVRGVETPTFDDISQFCNIGRTWGALRGYKANDNDAAMTPMYGASNAILYFPGVPALQAAEQGGRAWARTFRLGEGAAFEYRDDSITSWVYCWEQEERPRVLDPTCAVLFEDVFQAPAP